MVIKMFGDAGNEKEYQLVEEVNTFEEREELVKALREKGFNPVELVWDAEYPNSVWLSLEDKDRFALQALKNSVKNNG